MPTKARRVCSVVLRVALSALFALSAVAKLFAIDDFELYIFSYGFLPLNLCFIVARLCIGAELALALLIAVGCWRRWVNLAALGLLICFSLFLCYAILVGRDDSCQCFGRMADIPPAVSLLKNAVLIVLVLLSDRVGSGERRTSPRNRGKSFANLVSITGIVVALVMPFIVSVPDNWMFGPEEARFDQETFAYAIAEGDLKDYKIGEGRHLVAFVTPGCPYCRMTRQKLGTIAERHSIDAEKMVYLEPEQIGAGLFLDITRGMRPLVMLVDDGKVEVTYHYRNISERQIVTFLNAGVDK